MASRGCEASPIPGARGEKRMCHGERVQEAGVNHYEHLKGKERSWSSNADQEMPPF